MAEQVTYSIQVKTSDKRFAGTDNDVYIRIGCVKSKQCLCWKVLRKNKRCRQNGDNEVGDIVMLVTAKFVTICGCW